MKSFKVLLLVLVPFSLAAQNWQNICSPGITMFVNPGNKIACFRLDSSSMASGNPLDSIYNSYVTLRKFPGSQVCFDTIYGYVLGSKVYKYSNGTFIFFNHYGDSIRVNTVAAFSQSWKICPLPNSTYLQGTVSGIETDSVCGIPDQVKVITLQAKNASNQNINHPFNNKQILLSKNFGFTQIYDLVTFPSDTTPWQLIGKNHPAIGVQDFTLREAYNYEVGDEFHTDDYWGCSIGMSDVKTIHRILSKNVSVTEDTIIYCAERCRRMISAPPPYYSNSHDTVYDTVIIHKNSFYPGFNNQPQEFSPKTTTFCDLSQKIHAAFNEQEILPRLCET